MGWRGLLRFWVAVLSLLGIGAGILQTLGPLPIREKSAVVGQVVRADPHPAGHGPLDVKVRDASMVAPQPRRPGRDTPGPVADPDPAMLEPYAGEPSLELPRVAADGRIPMAAYAAGFDPSNLRPRVGVLIAGIGMSETNSLAAIKNLPGGITLAISPYAGDIGHLLAVARTTEHEYLLSIPMEPQGYPVNDPDDRYALMTSLQPAENLRRLRGILGHLTGYVGMTNALGQMHGERLAGVADQLDSVLEERRRVIVGCCSLMREPASRCSPMPGIGQWIWFLIMTQSTWRCWISGLIS